ncbi:MAG TPA: PIN domain-containing protein [Anaerolineae bacterium]|nr:PIN domain-containing protein [Anaerolineae bacterium]
MTQEINKPRVFVDSDVLFAGAASSSEHSASLVILRLAEITLIDAVVSEQVITEVTRNLTNKLPTALPLFNLLISRAVRQVPDPTEVLIAQYAGLADGKDLPILVSAVREGCPWLVTFNGRDYQPGHEAVRVVRPGVFVRAIRHQLSELG